ncbi:hypothetical protein COEREDRAFT_91957 [Coemansia reversa NRRL 1564]|uniref:UPF3 domain-containing protein n=1 Tax=Coemansia reversa (strain ATCC 12441 / NRRL 1564) TaxID=763665 RepID=A0A2G5BE05_COERN|nr:hypothetical protein COEREDRAFT_91957 [Coemansia reversa NRRL 1564]|eukprot:PIA17244.1 hypothetical protein COEREDRAFT_91957 [Coemansia reversa NRRL 1564]
MSTEDQALPPKRDNEPLVNRPGGRAPRNRSKPSVLPNRNTTVATDTADGPKKPRRRGPKPSISDTQSNNGSRNGTESATSRPRPAKPNPPSVSSSAKGKGVRPAAAHAPDSSNSGVGGSSPRPRSRPNKPRPASFAAQASLAEDAVAGKPRGQNRPRRRQNNPKPATASPAASAPTKQPPPLKILQRNPPKPKEQTRQQGRVQPKSKPIPKSAAKPKSKQLVEPNLSAIRTAPMSSAATTETQDMLAAKTAIAGSTANRPLPAPRSKPVHKSVKLCIRWLPADLPEHVFWRAIESALPWFDAANTGSVEQRKRFVLTALLPGHDNPQDDMEDSKAKEPLKEDDSSEDTMASQEHIATKGATTEVMQSFYESKNLARLDSEPYWRRFVPGKQHASKAKPVEPSCAYIAFASDAEAGHFYRKFHGHVFGRVGGVQWRARVELAKFQSLFIEEHMVSDPLNGTIDSDPDFMAFLDPRVQEKPPQQVSYAAAVGGSDKKVTPLIRYLRELKAKKNLSQSKAAGKKVKPPTQQQQKESSKKPRRRNR